MSKNIKHSKIDPPRLLCTILPAVSVDTGLKMPQGTAIAELEKGQILALHRECVSFRRIADMTNRSLGAMKGVIRQVFKYKAPRQWKGNQKLSQTPKRAMIWVAFQGGDSAWQIQAELKLPIGNRRVQQVLGYSSLSKV